MLICLDNLSQTCKVGWGRNIRYDSLLGEGKASLCKVKAEQGVIEDLERRGLPRDGCVGECHWSGEGDNNPEGDVSSPPGTHNPRARFDLRYLSKDRNVGNT